VAVFAGILDSFKHFEHSFKTNTKKDGCFSGELILPEFYRADKTEGKSPVETTKKNVDRIPTTSNSCCYWIVNISCDFTLHVIFSIVPRN